MSEQVILNIAGVNKRFGGLQALTDVGITIKKGQIYGLIGPNGAGKTTFFNLISGFLPPTKGRILLDNNDITALSPHRRVALGMARTFQITEIFPELTVRENLRVPVEVAAGLRLRP